MRLLKEPPPLWARDSRQLLPRTGSKANCSLKWHRGSERKHCGPTLIQNMFGRPQWGHNLSTAEAVTENGSNLGLWVEEPCDLFHQLPRRAAGCKTLYNIRSNYYTNSSQLILNIRSKYSEFFLQHICKKQNKNDVADIYKCSGSKIQMKNLHLD